MAIENWSMVLVVLAAVLVGAAIPVLVQLRATLRVGKTLQRSGARLEEALGATTAAAGEELTRWFVRLVLQG